MRDFVLTSESVTAGHPDKLCDQISDAVVDAHLAGGARTGCVCECALASGVVFLSIRHGGPLDLDPAALARRVLAGRGYGEGPPPTVMLDMVELPDRWAGEADPRAGQMTTAFGHACGQTPALMPLPIEAAHRLTARLGALAEAGTLPWLTPDGQAQVAVRFEGRRAAALTAIAITASARQPLPHVAEAEAAIAAEAVAPALAGLAPDRDGATRFVLRLVPGAGGPRAHAGLTGRKGGDDGYGGFVRQASPALSGKDPMRIDRTGAYAARQAAVSVVRAGLAAEAEVQLSWVIGDAAPISVEVDSFGTGAVPDAEISAMLRRAIDFRPAALVERLGLWDLPGARGGRFYERLAAQGHFGRPGLDLPWDRPVPLG